MSLAHRGGDLVELVNEVLDLRRRVLMEQIPFPTNTALLQIHTEPAKFQGIEALAAQTERSGSYLRKHFKGHVGVSVRTYLAAFKVFVTFEQLVRSPQASMEHVATAAGYSSRSTLGHAFRKHTGLTPAWVTRVLRGRHFPQDLRGLVEAAVVVREVAVREGRLPPLPRARVREIRRRIVSSVRELQRRAPPLHSLGRPP